MDFDDVTGGFIGSSGAVGAAAHVTGGVIDSGTVGAEAHVTGFSDDGATVYKQDAGQRFPTTILLLLLA